MIRALVQRAVTVALLVLVAVLFGGRAYLELPRESAPDVEIPVVLVTTPYIGVAPEDIEGLVTNPLEDELASLTDVKKMSSSSAEGLSVVSIEFEPEVDIDDALQKVRDRVNRARPKLPDDAEDPTVAEVSFSDIPVLLVTLAGGVDEQGLKSLAEDLEEKVVRLPGVLEAGVTGGREREILVQVYPERLTHFGLGMNDVIGAIQNENVNIPGGNVTVGSGTYLLRTPGEFTDARQVEEVAIKRVGDRPVFVSDLARVVDGFEERSTYARMNGVPSVTLSVKKRTGANILEVADGIKELVALESGDWPDGVTYKVTADQSEAIEDMVSELENNIVTALILVVAVLLVFMGARNSLFVAVAIPLSMLISFLVLDALGFTLNMVVLFSLILALGMLVDNAIVVVENIYRHLEEGLPLKEAAIVGTREVAMAVAASTATTVAAFFPMVFWSGIMGQFMGYLPKTVIIVLTASLVVAVAILPVAASQWMRLQRKKGEELIQEGVSEEEASHLVDKPVDESSLSPVMRKYVGALKWSIHHRYRSALIGAGTLVFSVVAYGFLNHGVEFFPSTEPDRAVVSVKLPEGADLEATDKVVRRIEGILASEENVDIYVSEVGVSGSSNPMAGASEQTNAARISVDFLPTREKAEEGEPIRVEDTDETIARIREAVAMIPGADIAVNPEEMGPPVGDPISVEISGDDFHQLGLVAPDVIRQIGRLTVPYNGGEVAGATDLTHNYRVGRPELRLRVNRGAAKRVGVSTNDVGSAVRTAISGTKASALRAGDEEYDITVELAPEYRDSLQDVLAMHIPGKEDMELDTFAVPLSAVASYELAGGSGTIEHIDQKSVVTITGDVVHPSLQNKMQKEIQAWIDTYEAPEGVSLRLGGANDEQAEAASFLGWALISAIFLILIVLVSQFNSITMPAIIMFTVVLSLVGVLWGLIFTGTAFGIIMTGIGVISLAGVVVNNAIVLLDYVQQLRKQGMDVEDALIKAGVTRFRPVILTAVTTTLGLIPMALGITVDFVNLRIITGSSSAQFWGPMAIAVIFGLTFATVLTLVMVPTLYSIQVDVLRFMRGRSSGGGGRMGKGSAMAAAMLAILAGGMVALPAQAATLEEVYQAAEEENIDLQLAIENTKQYKAIQWQALSALLPQVNMGAQYAINQNEVIFDAVPGEIDPAVFAPLATHPDSPFTVSFLQDAFVPALQGLAGGAGGPTEETGPIVIQAKSAWTGNLNITQPIFSGGALPAWLSAKQMYDASVDDLSRSRQLIRVQVAASFYTLDAVREAVGVYERSIETAEESLRLAKARTAAGLEEQRVVLQAELQLARARRDLEGAQRNLVDAEERFRVLTGLPGDTPLEVGDRVMVPETLEDSLAIAFDARPDISAEEHRRKAVKLERTARDLTWMPSVDFYFTEIYQQIPGFVPQNFQWQTGFQFNWQIFNGGARIGKTREMASKVRAQENIEELTFRQVEQDVRTAWADLERAELALTSVESELALADENYRLTELSYKAGSATYLDVETAALSRDNVRISYLSEKAQRDQAAIQVLAAIGAL